MAAGGGAGAGGGRHQAAAPGPAPGAALALLGAVPGAPSCPHGEHGALSPNEGLWGPRLSDRGARRR